MVTLNPKNMGHTHKPRPFLAQRSPMMRFTSYNKRSHSHITASKYHKQETNAAPPTIQLLTSVINSHTLAKILGAGAAAIVLASSPPSFAELQTVPADQVTSMAKPLKVQTVNKGRIWLLFILGATSLFGVTVLAENNKAWFPAIARANKAMAASAAAAKKKAEIAEREEQQLNVRLAEVEQERIAAADFRSESAVADGLAQARRPPPAQDTANKTVTNDEIIIMGSEEADSTYPMQLDREAEEEVVEDEESSTTPENIDIQNNADDSSNNKNTSRAAPLFEIGADQIESSTQSLQQRVLNGLSVEELQRELEARVSKSPGDQ